MKTRLLATASLLLMITSGCNKDDHRLNQAQVVRDCTGTYLRVDKKDYHVCNVDRISSYADGAAIQAAFINLSACDGPEGNAMICHMLHANEGWIEIMAIE